MNTSPISNPIYLPPPGVGRGPSTLQGAGQTTNFKDFLLKSIGEVNGMQQDAEKAVEQLVTGGDINMAEVMTTVQKADMSFRLMMQMRNKLIQAYEEIKDIRI